MDQGVHGPLDRDVRSRNERMSTQDICNQIPQVQNLAQEMYSCDQCLRQCSTYRGLFSHRRQAHHAAHGTESALAPRVGTNVSFAWQGDYPSRTAHLAHLTTNLRCALGTMIPCPRLSESELKAAKAVKTIIRTAPLRRGPKYRDSQETFAISQPVSLLDIIDSMLGRADMPD
eukprot:6416382-Amphidinium_carterae.1